MKIRAAVLNKAGAVLPYSISKPLSIEEIEIDPPEPGEVLVKMGSAGLCHSDLSAINGTRPRPTPMVIGHEAAGTVEEVGPGVDDLKRGDHVVLTFIPSCGHCLHCAEGVRRSANRRLQPTQQARSCQGAAGCIATEPPFITTWAALPSRNSQPCRDGRW